MKIKIRLHPGSSQQKIEKISEDSEYATSAEVRKRSCPSEIRGKSAGKIKEFPHYEVWIKEKPIEGKANLALEKFLKKYFGKPVKVVKGFKSRKKVAEI